MNAIPYSNTADFQTAFARLAELERRAADKAAKLKAKIADLTAKHEAATAADAAEIDRIRAGLMAYAEANREELTGGKSKTVKLAAGCIKWRKTPAKVEITGDAAEIIAALKRRRLSRFIRVKEEIDRAAVLKEAAAIKTPIDGLKITDSGETLSIETGA